MFLNKKNFFKLPFYRYARMKAIIIGTGVGGLATAIRLSHQGYDVDVFEANAYPGGKLSEINLGNYRFDAGPSLFTMPMYVDELFSLCGEDPRVHFNYFELDTICNYFWEDGTRLSAFANQEQFFREVEHQLEVNPRALKRALEDSASKYELTGRIFLERPLHKWKTWFSKDVFKALLRIYKLDIFKTMHQVNKRNLGHPKLVQFFDRFATYNGSNPYQASGILNIIPHFEHHFGAYFPKGGMVEITNSLYKLAERNGVCFHFNQKVDEIIVEKNRAKGIRIGTEERSADIVVSNMDIYPTYKKLLPNEKHPDTILNSERSSSALIFYWGIQRSFPELELHNIFFSDDYKQEFVDISNGSIYHDPTVYINIGCKLNDSDTPSGTENWFTMINVPSNTGQNWDELIKQARENIIIKLNRMLGVDISSLIVCEDMLDPRKIELRTSSFAGALYGTASNDRMAAFKRHANFSSKIQRLYFCGGSVHPGGGIPLCLLSAKIVANLVSKS